jgi:hypothetical protein
MVGVTKEQEIRSVEILRPPSGRVELLDQIDLEVLDQIDFEILYREQTEKRTVCLKMKDDQFDKLTAHLHKNHKRETGKCT